MEFEMKDMRELKHFLEIQVRWDREHRQIHIDQSEYINTILEKYDLANCNPVTTPIITSTRIRKSTSDDNNLMKDSKKYQSIVESQMYAMLYIKLDLAYAISQVSQFSNLSNASYYTVAKHVLRYLKETFHVDIIFNESLKLILELYCDANWANEKNRKSILIYIAILTNEMIIWKAKKQSIIAISNINVKYMTLL